LLANTSSDESTALIIATFIHTQISAILSNDKNISACVGKDKYELPKYLDRATWPKILSFRKKILHY